MKHLHWTLACFHSRANFELLSISLQDSIRFFLHPTTTHLWNALRLSVLPLKIDVSMNFTCGISVFVFPC